MQNPLSFLTSRSIFGAMLAIILVLGGVIITPFLTLSVPTIRLMIDEAVKCSAEATIKEVHKIRMEKLDVDTYVADQRRVTDNEDQIRKSIDRIDKNVDWLIKMQLKGNRGATP